MEIIIKGERGEGSITLARFIYRFLKMLGYNVDVENKLEQYASMTNVSPNATEHLTEIKTVNLRTETMEDKDD